MNKFIASGIIIVCLALISCLPLDAAIDLDAKDQPDDIGGVILIDWNIPAIAGDSTVLYYLQKAESATGPWTDLQKLTEISGKIIENEQPSDVDYYYRIKIISANGESASQPVGPVRATANWFHFKRVNVLVGILIVGLLVGGFILYGKYGGKLYTRPIAGLQAIDEAIGRATEMGKSILYSAGRGKLERPATLASMNILGTVIEKVAAYNTRLIFPNNDPVTMAVAQEVAYEGYSRAGHPDNYNPDNIFFVTDSQFGYAAAVDGIMMRERPATNLFFGTFEAESLILAETGNSIGAIQIAGTDSSIQMSFFVVACDYVLIGEELFAASGYLSKDPQVLGSLKGSDYSKLIIVLVMFIGVAMALLGYQDFIDWFKTG